MKTFLLTLCSFLFPFYLIAQTLLPGMPDANDKVHAIVRSGNIVFVGGEFTTFGGLPRAHLAAFDANTGVVLSWAPDPDGNIYSLLVADNKLLAGGNYSNISGVVRENLTGYDLNGLTLLSYIPPSNAPVYDLKFNSGKIYFPDRISSGFSVFIKRFVLATGVIDPWMTDELDLYFGGFFAIQGNHLYVGGDFADNINGQYYVDMARFDLVTGAVDSTKLFNFSSGAWIEEVIQYNNHIYIAGSFTTVNGINRKGAVELDVNGDVTTLDFHCSNSQNYALFPQGNTMWVGGNSANIGAGMSYRLAQVKLSTGYATCWSTMSNSGSSYICAIFVQGDTVYAGGPDQSVSADPLKVFTGNPSYVNLGPDITLQTGGSVQLATNIPFATYSWSTGATTPTITVSTAGTYWVNVTTSSGCQATDSVIVNLSTGIYDVSADSHFKLFPNPVSSVLHCVLPENSDINKIIVSDVQGKVCGIYFKEELKSIDVTTLPGGIYFVSFIDENATTIVTEEFIKL